MLAGLRAVSTDGCFRYVEGCTTTRPKSKDRYPKRIASRRACLGNSVPYDADLRAQIEAPFFRVLLPP